MRLRHILIKVDDQDKALAFYTSVVGFVKSMITTAVRSAG